MSLFGREQHGKSGSHSSSNGPTLSKGRLSGSQELHPASGSRKSDVGTGGDDAAVHGTRTHSTGGSGGALTEGTLCDQLRENVLKGARQSMCVWDIDHEVVLCREMCTRVREALARAKSDALYFPGNSH